MSPTRISWTGETWNPLVGCTPVSAGCDFCYAARDAGGRLKNHPAYAGLVTDGAFNGTVRLLEDRLGQPLRWQRPRLIFCPSMGDLFHPTVPDRFIARVLAVMALAPRHTFQLLTKRPQRMAALFGQLRVRDPQVGFLDLVTNAVDELAEEWDIVHGRALEPADEGWPLRNVWVGTSIESQAVAWRARHLLETPAVVHFVSAEPLLGPLDLGDYLPRAVSDEVDGDYLQGGVDWVIVGGESGPKARPMHPDWARQLRDQCAGAGVAFHFKQMGEWSADEQLVRQRRSEGPITDVGFDSHGDLIPDGERAWVEPTTRLYRVGRAAAGRELDGQVWADYPTARTVDSFVAGVVPGEVSG